MEYFARFFGFSLILSTIACASVRTDAPVFERATPQSMGFSVDSLERMNNHFHSLVDEGRLAGVQTAILRQGQLVHFDSYGYADIEAGKQLDKHSIFRIFSMTKPIVSVALMQLWEAGKLKLEDPISKHLSEFSHPKVFTENGIVAAKSPVRVIDLLRHSSGYSYGRTPYPHLDSLYAVADLNRSKDNREFMGKLGQLPLQFEPGQDWQYGLSTNVCGYLVEVISGQPLDEYLQEHILAPLGMEDTHFQIPESKIDRFTVGYRWAEDNGLSVVEAAEDNRYTRPVTLFNGGGGLVSTTYDYLKFCQMLLNDGEFNGSRILRASTVNLMLKDHTGKVRTFNERLRLPQREAGFGLGVAIKGESPDTLEPIYGWGGAVGTYFRIDTERELVYLLMIQLSPYRQLGIRHLFQDYVYAALEK